MKQSPLPVAIIKPFQRFFRKIAGGSFPLFGAAVVALVWANTSEVSYRGVWNSHLTISLEPFRMSKSLLHWIDEALMTLFFFTVGLEIKREILTGELASFRKALLPAVGALGGMLAPAVIYAAFNHGTIQARGWAIPMATDIAFSLGVLAVLGNRIPVGLKVFLSALAIADDLGAVLVIALFYTQTIVWQYLLLSLLFLAALALTNLLWIRWTFIYAVLGIGIWFTMLSSGVHATVAGVLVAIFIPARGKCDTDTFIRTCRTHLERFACEQGDCGYSTLLNPEHLNAVRDIEIACHDVETPLQRMEYSLHSWIAYLVLPLFALGNAGLTLTGLDLSSALQERVSLGIVLGLVLGKPLGIISFTYLAHKALKSPLPEGVTWQHVTGAGALAGIGFTMSLFMASLSFSSSQDVQLSKLAIMVGSLASAGCGLVILALADGEHRPDDRLPDHTGSAI
jgi:NhaA family Na+:H+ antiporter